MARFAWRATTACLMTLFLGCSGSVLPWRDDPPLPSAADPASTQFTQWMNGPDHLALARSLVAQGYYSVAIRQLTDTLEDKGDAPEPYYLLGVCYRETKEYNMAQLCFKRAIDLDVKFAPAYSGLGITYFLVKAFDPAQESMRQAIHLDPANADYHNNLGVLLLSRNRLDEAKACFEMCMKINPDNRRAANNLAECFLRQGNDKQALDLLQSLFLPSTAYSNLGNLYLKLGRPDKARQMFSNALAIDPTLALAKHHLERLPKEGGKTEP